MGPFARAFPSRFLKDSYYVLPGFAHRAEPALTVMPWPYQAFLPGFEREESDRNPWVPPMGRSKVFIRQPLLLTICHKDYVRLYNGLIGGQLFFVVLFFVEPPKIPFLHPIPNSLFLKSPSSNQSTKRIPAPGPLRNFERCIRAHSNIGYRPGPCNQALQLEVPRREKVFGFQSTGNTPRA